MIYTGNFMISDYTDRNHEQSVFATPAAPAAFCFPLSAFRFPLSALSSAQINKTVKYLHYE
ncbi:MAG: hypothetical protein LBD35_00825 [Prevotellaceae bacterium]|jgi:hypothetical protein|nr:hypothetical protein [Prevotellaceae bacterium]